MIGNILRVLFFPFLGRIKSAGPPPAPPPLSSARLHLFAGDFGSEVEATDYALGLADQTLAGDLGGAVIGPDDIEIIFGHDRIAAARPMLRFSAPVPRSAANTYIMVSDRGYDASALTGHRVNYLGLCDVS
ncbi:hypothetical protein [Pseudooctadecabacter sp.]|uniref:hypothetical protein n=1 Tax=Pseudooctadecabacter sp. TaxID=1966338 RepID=UPI0025D31FB1|nr:hypothetical protein [Pseudooctadecabacter sp.]